MPDVNRIYPPDYAILHNSVSPEGYTRFWSDDQWAAWFSDIGFNRTYGGRNIGLTYKGKVSYSAIQYAVVPNGDSGMDGDIYKDTWRVVSCIDNPSKWVTWHAGNYDINRRSDGYEFYGRYDDKPVPDNAMKAFADHARTNIEVLNGGRTIVKGHKEVSLTGTGCPNQMMDKRNMAIEMINNPSAYAHVNVKVQPKVEPSYDKVVDVANKIFVAKEDIQLINVITKQVSKTLPKGTELEISAYFDFEGVRYGFTEYSWNNKLWTGFDMSKLQEKIIMTPQEPQQPETITVSLSEWTKVNTDLSTAKNENSNLRATTENARKQADEAKAEVIKISQEKEQLMLKSVNDIAVLEQTHAKGLDSQKTYYDGIISAKDGEIETLKAKILELGTAQAPKGFNGAFYDWFIAQGRQLRYFLTNALWGFVLLIITLLLQLGLPGSEISNAIAQNYPELAGIIFAIFSNSAMQAYLKDKQEQATKKQEAEQIASE